MLGIKPKISILKSLENKERINQETIHEYVNTLIIL